MEKYEGPEIDRAAIEEYNKRVPLDVRVGVMRRMQGFPELDEELDEEKEEGKPTYSEV